MSDSLGHLRRRRVLVFPLALATAAIGFVPRADESATVERPTTVPPAHRLDLARLPLAFEQNAGQTDASVRFLGRSDGATVFIRPADAVVAVPGSAIAMRLVGGDELAEVVPADELPGRVSYFLGNEPSKWRADLRTFRRVECRGVWPGIDVAYHGSRGLLEYDFIVAPGADPDRIAVEFDGADSVEIDRASGDLVVRVADGEMRQERPTVYQTFDDERRAVAGEFVLAGDRRVRFHVADYDRGRPLVIDPPLRFASYIAAPQNSDFGRGIVSDAAGDLYVCGATTMSIDFPRVFGPVRTERGFLSGENAFLSKVSASGGSLLYSTYFGGGGDDDATGVALDGEGNAFVCGTTSSWDFPTTAGALGHRDENGSGPGGPSDGFVVKLDTRGAALVYSVELGDNGADEVRGIVVDGAGRAVVVGSSDGGLSAAYRPGPTSFQPSRPGGNDAFVMWLGATGSTVEAMTWIGGTGYDFGTGIALYASGDVVVTGGTASYSIAGATPIRPWAGGYDLFVAKLGDGGALRWLTDLGGTGSEPGALASVDLDAQGHVFVATTTDSADFPTTPGAVDRTFHGGPSHGTDAVVARLTADGLLDWATYLGGTGDEYPVSMAVDRSTGECLVVGATSSTDFPTSDPVQIDNAGDFDGFVSQLAPTGATLSFSTYLGGGSGDWLEGVCAGPGGAFNVTGYSHSQGLGTRSAFHPNVRIAYGGGNPGTDVIVASYAPQGAAADTVALVPTAGRLAFDPRKGVWDFSAKGRFSFLPSSPDGDFDPRRESITLTMGDRLDPYVLFIPPGDGWKSRSGRHTWTSRRRTNPHVTLVIDGTTKTFSISQKRFSLPTPAKDRVYLGFTSRDDSGSDERKWTQTRKGRFTLP